MAASRRASPLPRPQSPWSPRPDAPADLPRWLPASAKLRFLNLVTMAAAPGCPCCTKDSSASTPSSPWPPRPDPPASRLPMASVPRSPCSPVPHGFHTRIPLQASSPWPPSLDPHGLHIWIPMASASRPIHGKADNRADWNEARNWFFVTILKEYNSPKYRGQNGWTKEAWNSMTQRINEKFASANFVVQQLKDREQRLKKEYNAVKTICSKSGFGWDNNLKMATTIDGLWEELPQNLQKWMNKSFPYYDDLHEIYNGKIAEGKRCRRSSEKAQVTENKVLEEEYEQMSPPSPASDPYSMAKCMNKLKSLFLPQTELLKAINFLKGDREARKIFICCNEKHLFQYSIEI